MEIGKKVVEIINSLGYRGSHEIQAEDFEWMCEDEAVLPFLDWFCSNVNPSLIITSKEMTEFSALKAAGGILEGAQLEQALQSSTNIEEDDLTEDQLKKEIAELQGDIKSTKKRKEILIQQRNRLSIHHTERQHKITKLGAIEANAKKSYKRSIEQIHSDNNKMNTALKNLSKAFNDVSMEYSCDGDANDAMFLSHLSLQDYCRAEEHFTQDLTKYTKKQFFEGITGITGQDSPASWYQLLDLSDPSTLVLKGEKEHITASNCKEVARLQALYPTSQMQYVKALVEKRRLQAACERAHQLINSMDTRTFPTNASELSQRVHDVEKSLAQASRQACTLADTLPELIEKNAALQQTEILFGDYNLKIARQEYFTSKQDEVIKQLTVQRARHEFLSMAFETEAAFLRETHRLLTASRDLLHTDVKKHKDQITLLTDPSLQPPIPRATIDSRDLFVTRMHQILNYSPESKERSQKQLFLTYESLIEGAKQLVSNLTSLKASLSSTNTDQDSKLTELERNLKVCEDLVYSGSANGGEPVLSPRPIIHAINQLDMALKSLEKNILDVMTQYSSKKKLLHEDPLLAKQRTLYTSFFTDQSKLRRTVDDLTHQLQAQMVE
ncbi:HAUS augmin-like complex subunit 3 [Antedon mediterranea]|uniref:HAUS augmin-like complex subunit 3 n=1 Tax=Antedon mediterranea TaxID=105859 RepID=UPI003AF6048E